RHTGMNGHGKSKKTEHSFVRRACSRAPQGNLSPRTINKLETLPAFSRGNFPLHFEVEKTANHANRHHPCCPYPACVHRQKSDFGNSFPRSLERGRCDAHAFQFEEPALRGGNDLGWCSAF